MSSFFNEGKLIDVKQTLLNITISPHIYAVKFIGIPLAIFLTSIGFAFSGYSMQAVSRNPLATPTTLGFMPAAMLGMLVSKAIITSEIYLPVILGILFASAIIALNFIMMKGNIFEAGFKPILVGFAIGGMMNGVIILLDRFVDQIKVKEIGFLYNPINFYSVVQLYICGSLILVSGICFMIMAPYYQIIERDVILAKSLGIKVDLVFWMTGLFAVICTVCSIILIGPLTLIGMVTPHVARILNPKGRTWENLLISMLISILLIASSRWLLDTYTSFNINFFSSVAALPVFGYIFFSKRYRKHVE
ncbi:iron chelate uptake ABC transporter family permease subunit [Ureaplasma diversum]|uniref:iron chelate uptake ABC transporter family permease subunit n=1 Tax=Ureaplasma diversum TaxID=42094 RepID=UPI001AD7E862|nr:iron chelate uptake ABC transporter family permease subunit [Ureaplasma diversum]